MGERRKKVRGQGGAKAAKRTQNRMRRGRRSRRLHGRFLGAAPPAPA